MSKNRQPKNVTLTNKKQGNTPGAPKAPNPGNPGAQPSESGANPQEEMVSVKKAQLAKLLELNAQYKDEQAETLYDLKQVIDSLMKMSETFKGQNLLQVTTRLMKGEDLFPNEMAVLTGFMEKYKFVMELSELPELPEAETAGEEGKEVKLNP